MREERAGKLVWDDQSKRGDNQWWEGNNTARSRIRQLLGVENNGHDLTGYELVTVKTVRDYEKYAGIHFKNKSFLKYTKDNLFPPNPYPYKTEQEWEDSFMVSFYHLVNITREMLPADDYESILVAFDDETGTGVSHTYISDKRLSDFLNKNQPIHYEEMIMVDKQPSRVVYWGLSKERGWAERVEFDI